jgi:putative FmdB family regulatory protein
MPTYEYACRNCGKKFSVVMMISEYGTKRVRCPKCNGLKVDRRISSFHAKTSKKS